MTRKTCFLAIVLCMALNLALLSPALASEYKIAEQVGNLQFSATIFPDDVKFLGLAKAGAFTLKDVKAPFVLVDVFSTTCPHCMVQAPTLNALFNMASGNAKTKDALKFMGVGAGDNDMKLQAWKQMQQVQFALIPDTDMKVFNALKLPGTPVSVILNKDGKVVWKHIGPVEDAEATLKEIIAALKL